MAKKYEIVACVGEPWDCTYEKVDEVTNWKEARRLEKLGANIYLNGQRVFFVDHNAVQKAFDTIKGLYVSRRAFMWDEAFLDIEDVIDLEEAHSVLKQNNIKVNEEWEKKINRRQTYESDPLAIPLMERPRFLFKATEPWEIPF